MNKTSFKPYTLAFLLGVISGIWLLPPVPSPELSDYERDKIMYELLDHLESHNFRVTPAKSDILDDGWWFW